MRGVLVLIGLLIGLVVAYLAAWPQLVEVPAYGGGRELELLGEGRGRGMTVQQDAACDPRPGRLLPVLGPVDGSTDDFHNAIVRLLLHGFQRR